MLNETSKRVAILESLIAGPAYGLQLIERAKQNSNIELSQCDYGIFRDLEREGYVSSYDGETTPERGEPRRYYQLTEKGTRGIRAYDCKAGIQVALTSAATFNKLLQDRWDAFQRNEKLQHWALFGTLVLGNSGGVKKIVRRTFPDVVLGTNSRHEDNTLSHIHVPSHDNVCAHCGLGWTPQTLYTFGNRADKWMHDACWRLAKIREYQDHYLKIFKDAGVELTSHRLIPNKYSEDLPDPWLVGMTARGEIMIGWRKRVINIDWSKTKISAGDLFVGEDTTRYEHSIHAWTRDDAVRYLKALMMAEDAR